MNSLIRSAFVFSLILLQVLYSSKAFSEELKIVDERGLIRASRDIKESAEVGIKLGKTADKGVDAILQNIDGIGSDVRGSFRGADQVVFSNVRHGTWKLLVTPKEYVVVDVQVNSRK